MKLKLWILFIFVTSNVFAHDLYLQARPFVLSKPDSVKLSMYLAAAFPGEFQKWRFEKTSDFRMVGPDNFKELDHRQNTDPMVSLNSEGTYVIGWSSTPSYITIDAKHFEEYVTAEGYKNVLEARKASGKADSEAKEKYTRNLKTFVQAGSKTTSNFSRPFGYKIEIVPKQNPYDLKVGDELALVVLFDGKPLGDVRVMGTFDMFSKEHDVYAQTAQSDANGIAKIKINKPGIWLIRANYMMPAKEDPKAEWESFWANCSFQIR